MKISTSTRINTNITPTAYAIEKAVSVVYSNNIAGGLKQRNDDAVFAAFCTSVNLWGIVNLSKMKNILKGKKPTENMDVDTDNVGPLSCQCQLLVAASLQGSLAPTQMAD